MSRKQILVEAFTEMAPKYEQTVDAELRRFWGWSYDAFIDNLLDSEPLREGETVLDIATGTGVIPRKLARREIAGVKITGLDITFAMLQRAAALVSAGGHGGAVRLTCGSAMALPYRGGRYDVIFCGLATHHLDIPALLAEMHRVLKPGGRIAIADVGGSPAWRLPVINTVIRTATFLYFLPREGRARAWTEASALDNVFTQKEWTETLNKTGFEGISISELPASRVLAPTPLVIRAKKTLEESNHADNSNRVTATGP